MLKNLVITAAILAIGIGGYLWLNQDSSAPRRASAAPTETTPNRADGNARPAANVAGEASNSQPQNSAQNTETNNEKNEQTERQPPQNSRRGMGMFGRLAQQSATSVEVMRPQAQVQAAELSVYGMVKAQTNAVLRTETAATVESINVTEGSFVQVDQPLITLQSDSTIEQLRQREASLLELDARIRNEARKHQNDLDALEIEQELVRIAKNAVDRFDSLNSQQLSSNTDYESALRTYQSQLLSLQNRELTIAQYEDGARQSAAQRASLESQIRQSNELVASLDVRAPFKGLVAQIDITNNQELTTGESLLTLYDPESLTMTVRVPVRYRLDQNELESISAIDSDGSQWQATAIRPINEAGAQQLTLAPSPSNINVPLPGTHVALTLSYPVASPSIAIPSTALYDQQRIYVFDRDTRAIKAVEVSIVGRTDGGFLIDAEDIPRAPIVTTRLKNPVTGMQVSLVRPEQGAGS